MYKLGYLTVKDVKKFSLYNFFWKFPKLITRYEVVRLGQRLVIRVRVFNIPVGVYWEKI